MGKASDQIADMAKESLKPGEELIAVARVNYNGTIAPTTFTVNSQMIDGGEAEGTPDIRIDPESTAFFPTASQMGLALTGGRLFVWALGFSGKPKQFLGFVPLAGIDDVRGGETNPGRVVMRVVMRSGAMVDTEFMKGEAGLEFLAQFGALAGRTDRPGPASTLGDASDDGNAPELGASGGESAPAADAAPAGETLDDADTGS